ncbi:unnamed protein product [Hymenolepis diminuta]|uniref:Uncharacterized protein n=1 Tax=Hymenolepis diminuta TaxID=6216 RepID=A0A564YZN4_HYMDI|nr:unnamed protein product [Hymenolepis diminuta]
MHSCHNHQAAWRRYLRRGDRKGHLILRSQTTRTRRVCSLTPEQPGTPDVMRRPEGIDQNIILPVPPGLDGISLAFRSIMRQGRTSDQIYERAFYV